jgi:UDP-2,3-diacylglucosamine pyrophosphatase LpxH
VSDLHLQDRDEPFLFNETKEKVFALVAAEAFETGATLVLSGDVFDLTGMTPPAKGLDDFFGKVAPDAPRRTSLSGLAAQLTALQGRFPSFFAGLAKLAQQSRLWMIPGNHDCEIASPKGRSALATALGVRPGDLSIEQNFRAGKYLFTAHGNEYDDSNRTDCGCKNRGAIITAALYHGIIPALEGLSVDPGVAQAVPAVRPEENIVTGLEAHLGENKAQDLLVAFVELLRVNGYFTGFDAAKAWLITHLFRCLVTPSAVRKALADDTDLKSITRRHAEAIQSAEEETIPAGPKPDVVVMGHTHELDSAPAYVNLGTWIDHVSGLMESDLDKVDRSLPVLILDGEHGALHDCQGITGRVADGKVLWQRLIAA